MTKAFIPCLALMIAVAAACGTVSSSGTPPAISELAPATASAEAEQPKGEQTAVFAGGCFWGVEAVFEHVKGVKDVRSGYAGGDARSANYERVSSGATDHAEAVRVVYDPEQVTYTQLLTIFFSVAHDPTQIDRQGPDIGRHYRSAIFYTGEDQRELAARYIESINASGKLAGPIATQVAPLTRFHEAEAYHQDYMRKNPRQPYIVEHDRPKLEELKKRFPDVYVAKYFK